MDAKTLKSNWIQSVCVLVLAELIATISTSEIIQSQALQTFNYTHLQKKFLNDQNELVDRKRSCPRDCVCTESEGYVTAKCNHLEMGTQTFGEDITDFVIDKAEMAIQLSDLIFKKIGLHQVETIKIVNSNITSVGANAFHGLQNLNAVDLRNNNLKDIHPETFATNEKLNLLTLSHNPLTFPASDTSKYFLNVSSVVVFDISYCNMRYLTNNNLKYMSTITNLNLSGNNLFEIEADAFKSLIDLEYLDLSDNMIKSLAEGSFSENTELTILNIEKNPIDSVYGLQTYFLVTLNAAKTNIKIIGPSMFSYMFFISNINLSGNNIEQIHNLAFYELGDLKYLDISFNNLDFVSTSLIEKNTQLNIFNISNNLRLKHLPSDGFHCSAKRFQITLFDASNCNLEEIYEDSLKTFRSLIEVNLSANKIKLINRRVFSRCPELTEINLAYNLLINLDSDIFEKNTELEILNLQGNPLKVFSVKVFVYTPMLNWLDMSHAELTGLWKLENNQAMTVLQNLVYLNVSHNYIFEIKETELVTLKSLKILDIAENAFACNGEFKHTIYWLSSRNISLNNHKFTSDSKESVDIYTWDHYIRNICGTSETSTFTLSSVMQSTDENEEKVEYTTDNGQNYKNTEINNGDTKQAGDSKYNLYKQKNENDEGNEEKPKDVYTEKMEILLNTESILSTHSNTKHSYVSPIIITVLGAIFFLINIVIFVKYYFKRKQLRRRTNLMHQTTQDSQTATGMPLLRIYSFLEDN